VKVRKSTYFGAHRMQKDLLNKYFIDYATSTIGDLKFDSVLEFFSLKRKLSLNVSKSQLWKKLVTSILCFCHSRLKIDCLLNGWGQFLLAFTPRQKPRAAI